MPPEHRSAPLLTAARASKTGYFCKHSRTPRRLYLVPPPSLLQPVGSPRAAAPSQRQSRRSSAPKRELERALPSVLSSPRCAPQPQCPVAAGAGSTVLQLLPAAGGALNRSASPSSRTNRRRPGKLLMPPPSLPPLHPTPQPHIHTPTHHGEPGSRRAPRPPPARLAGHAQRVQRARAVHLLRRHPAHGAARGAAQL